MKIGKYIWLGLLSGCLWGCSSDADLGEEPVVEEFAEIPITFNFLTKGSLTTRVSEDPNDGIPASEAREVYVDRVLLKVYKRPIGTYSDNIEDFMLDERNDNKVLVCEEQTQFPYYIAHGRIDMSSNYEYRVSAIAYSEELNERELFDFEGRRLENTRLMLIDEQRKTPEIFFGVPVANGQDSVFRYAGSSGQELEGWLYRGIAGIELNLGHVDEGISKIELLADQLNTSVYTRYYDDFLSPLDLKQDDGSYTHFVLGSTDANKSEDGRYKFENDSVHIKGMNLLQGCTALRLRITRVNEGKESYEYCKLKLRETAVLGPEDFQTRALPPDEGNGTGIIPGEKEYPDNPEEPENPEEDPYKVCFLRNNYYRLEGDFQNLTTEKYVLKVTVNPNWDADINLSLDKFSGSDGN